MAFTDLLRTHTILDTDRMPRTLVVYYSRDGHTRKMAREIAAACGADVEEIVDLGGAPEQRSYLRSALEAPLHIAPAIAPPRHAQPRHSPS